MDQRGSLQRSLAREMGIYTTDGVTMDVVADLNTPVPGGVGPMTITMLMRNTLNSLKFSLGTA